MSLLPKPRCVLVCFLGVVAACLAAPRAPLVPAEQPAPFPKPAATRGLAPARIALLVGIEHYAPGTPASVPTLKGCRADVLGVRDTLLARFGFAPEDVRVLLDEQATHEAIVRAWREWLIPRAGPETEVVFWFSGHGARIPDASGINGAERGQTDNTILAYDSRSAGEDGSYDVTDDELYSLHAQLAHKTARLFAVIDACHSATGMRGGQRTKGVRAAGDGTEPLDRRRLLEFWPEVEREFIDEGPKRNPQPLPGASVFACTENQEALEYEWTDEGKVQRTQGALSFFLSDALAHAWPTETYRALADDAAVHLMREIPGQTPCYEGDLERQLFEARFEAAPHGILASVREEGRIDLAAGSLVGLAPGSELRLENTAGQLVGRALVDKAWAMRCVAKWKEPPRGDALGALRAFEESRPTEKPRYALFVEDPQLAAALPPQPGVELISAARDDAFLLQRAGEGVTLFAPEGIPIWHHALADFGPQPLAEQLAEEWRKETRHRALEKLTRGTLKISAHFVEPSAEDLKPLGSRAQSANPRPLQGSAEGACAAGGIYEALGGAEGGPLRIAKLVIQNESDCKDELYLYVLSVMESREQHLICNGISLLPGGTQEVLVVVCSAPDWPLERPVRDRYVVIATRVPADFRPFENVPVTRGPEEPLLMPEILSVGIQCLRTRGLERASTKTDGYGLTTVDLLVRDP